MQVVEKKYLKLISLPILDSWSVQSLLETKVLYNQKFDLAQIGDFLIKSRSIIDIKDDTEYQRVTVKIKNGGVIERDREFGRNIGTKKQFLVKEGQFIVSKIDARNGAFGIIPKTLEGAIVTNDFPVFSVNEKVINPAFLVLITTTKSFLRFAQSCSSGTTNRQRMDIDLFLNQKIPLPSLHEQNKIVRDFQQKIKSAETAELTIKKIETQIGEHLYNSLGIEKSQNKVISKGIRLVNFSTFSEWGLDKILSRSNYQSSKHQVVSIIRNPELAKAIFRGKSPKYKNGTNVFILNQKCNRWNKIDLRFVKSVDEDWFSSIDKDFLTREGDIIINSTGEGTIGRASYIAKEFEGLLYDSHILLLRLDASIINPRLFVEIFNSSYGQDQVNDIKSAQATKQTELGISNLEKVNFPLPASMRLQISITETLESLREEIAVLRKQAESNRKISVMEFEKEIFGK